MYSTGEVKEIAGRVIAATQSGNLELYSNYCLSGPKNERQYLDGFALYFHVVPEGCPRYLLVLLDPSRADQKDLFRQKILEARTPEHAVSLQREHVEVCNSVSPIFEDVVTVFNEAYCVKGLPLCFITFCTTEADGKEAMHIYHPPFLPTVVCLEYLQSAVRDAIDRS